LEDIRIYAISDILCQHLTNDLPYAIIYQSEKREDDMSWIKNSEPEYVKELNELGCRLSIATDCVVRPVVGLQALECKCGVIFPLYLLKRGNWAEIKRRHDEERKWIK